MDSKSDARQSAILSIPHFRIRSNQTASTTSTISCLSIPHFRILGGEKDTGLGHTIRLSIPHFRILVKELMSKTKVVILFQFLILGYIPVSLVGQNYHLSFQFLILGYTLLQKILKNYLDTTFNSSFQDTGPYVVAIAQLYHLSIPHFRIQS